MTATLEQPLTATTAVLTKKLCAIYFDGNIEVVVPAEDAEGLRKIRLSLCAGNFYPACKEGSFDSSGNLVFSNGNYILD